MARYSKALLDGIERKIEQKKLKIAGNCKSGSSQQIGIPAKGVRRCQILNKTEQDYLTYLQGGIIVSRPLWCVFESIKLRLADKTFYTPDFFLMRPNGEIEVHECKGFMRDDAAVKLKCAAEIFPFRFFLVKRKKGGGWDISEVGNKN